MDRKPNVLILFTDQQRYDTICGAGYPHMITPNLDRLIAEGRLFTNAYTSNPVCMAARHDLLVGLPGRAHGYYANHRDQPIRDYGLPTLPRIFAEHGYRTAAIGKMHFQPPRMHHGYNELIQMEEIPRRWQDDQYASFLHEEGLGDIQNIHGVRANLYHTPQTSQMDEAHHPNRWVADRAIDWLHKNGDHAFFLFCSWIHPHPPWATPLEFQGLYRHQNIPAPAPIARSYPFADKVSPWHGDDDTPEEIRAVREAYYSCVTHVDHHLGRVLDCLEETGHLDDTLIIFASDHGEMLYDRGMHQKSLPYDGAAKIPFIIRFPAGVDKGTKFDDFIDLLDILPTCLDACGLEYPKGKVQPAGASLMSPSSGRDRDHQICSFGTGVNRWVMCRDRRYKYIYYYNRGREEFYDMESDPQELANLMGTDQIPREIYEDLKMRAVAYERQWGPEELAPGETFVQLQGSIKEYGATAMHGNVQFQIMDRRDPQERGERFIRECEYAIKAQGNHGKPVHEVFNHPDYINRFLEQWESFGGGASVAGRLFAEDTGAGKAKKGEQND